MASSATTVGLSHRCQSCVISLHCCFSSVCSGTASLSHLRKSLQRGQLAACIFHLVMQRLGCCSAARLETLTLDQAVQYCQPAALLPFKMSWLFTIVSAGSVRAHLHVSQLLVRFFPHRADRIMKLARCQLGPATARPKIPTQVDSGEAQIDRKGVVHTSVQGAHLLASSRARSRSSSTRSISLFRRLTCTADCLSNLCAQLKQQAVLQWQVCMQVLGYQLHAPLLSASRALSSMWPQQTSASRLRGRPPA